MNGTQEGYRGGIPWCAILDSDGKVRATSDGPDGKIGFASGPVSIDRFLSMISSTRQRMTDEQLAALRKDLEPNGYAFGAFSRDADQPPGFGSRRCAHVDAFCPLEAAKRESTYESLRYPRQALFEPADIFASSRDGNSRRSVCGAG